MVIKNGKETNEHFFKFFIIKLKQKRKENKREEITKNIEKREALVEQVADGIWRIGVELPQNPLRELNSYLIKGKENERDLLIDTGFRREECREALFAGLDWRRIHAPRPTHPPATE